jgi:hypothetical protein
MKQRFAGHQVPSATLANARMKSARQPRAADQLHASDPPAHATTTPTRSPQHAGADGRGRPRQHDLNHPEDATRRLLAPRRLVPAQPPSQPARARRVGRWVTATVLALLAGAATLWVWPTAPPDVPAASTQAAPQAPAPAAVAASATLSTAITAPTRPVPLASTAELLGAPAQADWRWWRFKANPAILVLEFPTLTEQGLAMNRLAAMFEKRGVRRDRPLDDGELAGLLQRSGDTTATYYQGHDYPGARLARFFNLASAAATPLNAQEQRLRAVLLGAGVLAVESSAGHVAVGSQAVVSFTGLQADDPSTLADEEVDALRRDAVLRHELSHGEFFTHPAYRAHSLAFWSRVLTTAERKAWRKHLASLDYDPQDEELMANETQAMLMHTPDARAFNAGALGVSEAALASMRARFRAGEPRHGLNPAGR